MQKHGIKSSWNVNLIDSILLDDFAAKVEPGTASLYWILPGQRTAVKTNTTEPQSAENKVTLHVFY